jgi:hypothetical protein
MGKKEVALMASMSQTQAARRNIRKAISAARKKRTIAHLPRAVRSDLGRQASAARRRRGKPGHALEDRTRAEIYEVARRKKIPGRSSMGKWDLIKAIRKAS